MKIHFKVVMERSVEEYEKMVSKLLSESYSFIGNMMIIYDGNSKIYYREMIRSQMEDIPAGSSYPFVN